MKQKTFFALVRRCEDGGWSGSCLDVYPDERARYLAELGDQFVGEFRTAEEARGAVHVCMDARCAWLNHIKREATRMSEDLIEPLNPLERIAQETAGLENRRAWVEIWARLREEGRSARQATESREVVWRIRKRSADNQIPA